MVDFIVWLTHIYRPHMETFTESYENGRKGQTYINLVASGNRKVLDDERLHTALRSWPSNFRHIRAVICGPRETTPKEVTYSVIYKP